MKKILMILSFIAICNNSFCLTLFPVSKNSYSDTIPETKKETLEEYRQRIQKQLYSNDDDLYQESINEYESRNIEKVSSSRWKKLHPWIKFFLIVIGLAIVLIIGALISLAINPPSISFDLNDLSND